MKKYIFIALVLCVLGVAQPVRAMHVGTPTVQEQRDQAIIQLIDLIRQLIVKLQAQLVIELAKQSPVVPDTRTALGVIAETQSPLIVYSKDRALDNHYYLGGNCEQVVLYSNQKAMMYIPSSKSWTESDSLLRFFYKPQATNTTETLIFTAGNERAEYRLDIGEAIDRKATTGVEFDYQLGMCK